MSFIQLVNDYGYLAVFVACLLEGETILVLAGFAAHQGHLSLPLTLMIAFVAGALGDQIFFWIGRVWGRLLVKRFPGFRLRTLRIAELLRRHDVPLIVGIRFMYGLRIAGPIAIGISRVSPTRFAMLNLLGAAIWAPLVGGLGYLFGHTLELLLGDIQRFEVAAFMLIAAGAGLLALIRGWQWYRARQRFR